MTAKSRGPIEQVRAALLAVLAEGELKTYNVPASQAEEVRRRVDLHRRFQKAARPSFCTPGPKPAFLRPLVARFHPKPSRDAAKASKTTANHQTHTCVRRFAKSLF